MSQKSNFKGQWVDLIGAGTHVNKAGAPCRITVEFLEQVVANYDADLHEAPAVVGHPKEDAPAYGWVSALRVRDNRLEAQFSEVDEQFEELNRVGRFKKRSPSFYVDASSAPGGKAPYLRHVGFLGAQPPAIKGLRAIAFGEGETLTFDVQNFSEGDTGMDEKEKRELTESVTTSAFESVMSQIKKLFGGEKDAGSASFSEADLPRIVTDAVNTAVAPIKVELATAHATIKELRTSVEQQQGASTRGEIVSFCESLGAGKCPPAFKKMGVVEFMESLAALPTAERVTVISFSEDDKGNKTETKTESTPLKWFQNFMTNLKPFIEFGERYSHMSDDGMPAALVDPKQMDGLRRGMGTQTEGGAK